ncbi:MAG: hypothetical protein ACOX1P_01410 [Thermoguttaceae bacterium]|jgi:hypothetical protein
MFLSSPVHQHYDWVFLQFFVQPEQQRILQPDSGGKQSTRRRPGRVGRGLGLAGDRDEAAGRAVLEVVRRYGPARRIAGPAGAVREMLDTGLIDDAWLDRIPRELRPRLQELIDTPGG